MTEASPVSAPVCYRHTGRETYVRCTRCDRPICPDCMTEASVGFQCPECVAQGRRTVRPARNVFGGSMAGEHGYVTIGLVVLNVLAFLISIASAPKLGGALGGSGIGHLLGGGTPLLDNLAVVGQGQNAAGQTLPFGVADGEYYRLFTAMFMHYGLLHLGMNMWALWIIGRMLERALGPLRFLAVYLICGLGGSVSAYLFQPGGLTAGASGAIFGLFAVLFVVVRKLGGSTAAVLPVILINLVLTISVPGISIAGHLGGLVTGAIVGAGIAYAPKANRTAVQVGVCVATVLVLAGVTLWQTAMLNAV